MAIFEEYGTVKNSIQFAELRPPEKTKEDWKKAGITPRSVDREIFEAAHRIHMGVDSDYVNILLHALRTSLSDGWGGSMMATDISDVLFGTPKPISSFVNLGVLKKNMVNVVLHGHNPVLSETVVKASKEKDLVDYAKKMGAQGINLVGMCCTGNKLLTRKEIPIAGNSLSNFDKLFMLPYDEQILSTEPDVTPLLIKKSFLPVCIYTTSLKYYQGIIRLSSLE